MKDRDDMRPEYDFSNARRAKYAAGLSEGERGELLHRSAALDGQYWFGHTLQRIQELEAMVVAYLTLALDRTPEVASKEAAAILEGRDSNSLSRLASALGPWKPNQRDLESRFKKVLSERLWLIHKGGFALTAEPRQPDLMAVAVQRLAETAREADELREGLMANLEARLGETGLSSDEVRKRTDEVIHHWLAA